MIDSTNKSTTLSSEELDTIAGGLDHLRGIGVDEPRRLVPLQVAPFVFTNTKKSVKG